MLRTAQASLKMVVLVALVLRTQPQAIPKPPAGAAPKIRIPDLSTSQLSPPEAPHTNDPQPFGGPAPDYSIQLLRPAETDFVEVLRGGRLAAEIVFRTEGFSTPEDGYLVVVFGGTSNILCPQGVNDLEECPSGGDSFNGTVRLTVSGLDLGPQEICVEVHPWDPNKIAPERSCGDLVGSDRFLGRRESRDFFLENSADFQGPEPLNLLWQKMAGVLEEPICSVLCVGSEALSRYAASELRNCSSFKIFTYQPSEGHGQWTLTRQILGPKGVLGEETHQAKIHEKEVLRTDSAFAFKADELDQLDEEWAALEIGVFGDFNVKEVLEEVSQMVAGASLQAVFLTMMADQNRTELKTVVEVMEQRGFHTSAVGIERLLILNKDMYDMVYASAIEGRELDNIGVLQPRGPFVSFLSLPISSTAYGRLLNSYNTSGMIPDCRPKLMTTFHAPNGYEADDCPPNFNVYRTSRLKLFETALRPEASDGPRHTLHQHSLLHHRRNVFSEAGEDGVVEHLFEALGIEEGFCFEFGAWDGVFASNCRYWFEQGWDGLMVELEEDKFQTLATNYRNLPNIALVNAGVEATGRRSIHGLAEEYAPGREINLLSIDVDGLDYELLSSLKAYPDFKPQVIIAECNGFIRPDLRAKLSLEDSAKNMQQSLSVFRDLGSELGYDLVCFTQNAIFLRKDLSEQLQRDAGFNYPRSLMRLYLDALLINWNDIMLNVQATRGGAPDALMEAEIAEFGHFNSSINLQELNRLARLDEGHLDVASPQL